jgi:hypothetical protein
MKWERSFFFKEQKEKDAAIQKEVIHGADPGGVGANPII